MVVLREKQVRKKQASKRLSLPNYSFDLGTIPSRENKKIDWKVGNIGKEGRPVGRLYDYKAN